MTVPREKLQEMLDEARVLMRIIREAPAAGGFNPVHFQAQSARWLALVSDVHTALMELWDLQDRQQERSGREVRRETLEQAAKLAEIAGAEQSLEVRVHLASVASAIRRLKGEPPKE